MRRALVAAGAAVCLVVAGATVARAAAEPTQVDCTITDKVLSCPLPDAPGTVTTETATATETVTAAPVTEAATVTADPVTVTETATVTSTAQVTVTAQPTTSQPPTSSTPTSTTATPTTTTQPPASTGWPNADNTGVPAGVNLTGYTGPMTITAANTVIDGKTINGDLIIKASGVVVKNSRINGTIGTDENSTGFGFTIEDSEVHVGDRPGTGIGAVNFTVRRVEVTGGNRSMNCWKTCLIEDSWVHQQMADETGVYHESGIRMGANGTIRHNTIVCDAPDFPPDAGCSADLTGYGDFAAVTNMLIENNLMKASTGGFCAYGGSSAGKPYSNGARDIRFINNVFERGPGGKCGYYGAITDFNSSRPGNVWSGNKFDNGTVLNP